MQLKALLVSKDDEAAEALTQVLAGFSVAVDRSSAVEVAVSRLGEEHFDEIIVDFEDPATASLVLETVRRHADNDHKVPPVTVALLQDGAQIRTILGGGAHFILTKPFAKDQATTTLRAATALLKRERRRSFRVAAQAAVTLNLSDASNVEGILLDLSNGGMDVLAAQAMSQGALLHFAFELPGDAGRVQGDAEIAWANPNGQTGLRFLDIPAEMRNRLGDWMSAHAQEALPEEPDPVNHCKLTDLSLGGCYVETESPFPQASAVDLCLKAAGLQIHTTGVVRVMHPAHGMGIEFPSNTEEQRKSVGDFIEFLTHTPGTAPDLEISPRSLVADSGQLQAGSVQDSDDPLLELVRTGQGLEEQDFLTQLRAQRLPSE